MPRCETWALKAIFERVIYIVKDNVLMSLDTGQFVHTTFPGRYIPLVPRHLSLRAPGREKFMCKARYQLCDFHSHTQKLPGP